MSDSDSLVTLVSFSDATDIINGICFGDKFNFQSAVIKGNKIVQFEEKSELKIGETSVNLIKTKTKESSSDSANVLRLMLSLLSEEMFQFQRVIVLRGAVEFIGPIFESNKWINANVDRKDLGEVVSQTVTQPAVLLQGCEIPTGSPVAKGIFGMSDVQEIDHFTNVAPKSLENRPVFRTQMSKDEEQQHTMDLVHPEKLDSVEDILFQQAEVEKRKKGGNLLQRTINYFYPDPTPSPLQFDGDIAMCLASDSTTRRTVKSIVDCIDKLCGTTLAPDVKRMRSILNMILSINEGLSSSLNIDSSHSGSPHSVWQQQLKASLVSLPEEKKNIVARYCKYYQGMELRLKQLVARKVDEENEHKSKKARVEEKL